MDGELEKFLKFLVYFYLKYKKFDQAYILAKYLVAELPNDLWSNMLLATANYFRGQSYLSLPLLDKFIQQEKSPSCQKIYSILRSKVLWALGNDQQAQIEFDNFLRLKEDDIRLSVLSNLSTIGSAI
jgi:hypothetical protein